MKQSYASFIPILIVAIVAVILLFIHSPLEQPSEAQVGQAINVPLTIPMQLDILYDISSSISEKIMAVKLLTSIMTTYPIESAPYKGMVLGILLDIGITLDKTFSELKQRKYEEGIEERLSQLNSESDKGEIKDLQNRKNTVALLRQLHAEIKIAFNKITGENLDEEVKRF